MELATNSRKHRIKRMLFELNIEQQAHASQLHHTVSQLCQTRLVSVLDRCLAGIGADRLHRIDTLELDLGTLDPTDFEGEMLDRIEQALRKEIPVHLRSSHAVGDTRVDAYIQSQLELLSVYAYKGHLPWWAEHSETEPLAFALNELLQKAPDVLSRLFRQLVNDKRAITRIVNRCDEALLCRLGVNLSKSQSNTIDYFSAGITELLHVVSKQGRVSSISGLPLLSEHPRCLVWQAILHTTVCYPDRTPDRHQFWQKALLRLAVIMGSRYDVLISSLYVAMKNDGARELHKSLHKRLKTLFDELPVKFITNDQAGLQSENNLQDSSPVKPEKYQKNTIIGDPEKWFMLIDMLEIYAAHSEPSKHQNSSEYSISKFRDLVAVIIEMGIAPPPEVGQHIIRFETVYKKLLGEKQQHKLGQLIQAGKIKHITPDKENGVLDEGFNHVHANLSASDVTEFGQPNSKPATLENILQEVELSHSILAESEQAYVDNAGLVILWPFLGRFFERAGLLVDKHFKDTAAMQRAVGLLQYLATGEADGPEYLLPLNKMLCGMTLEDIYDFGLPIQQNEREECEQFLQAVIENASVLRNMSTAGFRGSFLLRKGMLETHDGAWVLRVEKASYDIVLERFPWSFNYIKLPWMNEPLRVEWG